MSELLTRMKEVKKMKRNTKLSPDELYALSSQSVAKNVYFEKQIDIEFAHLIINKYIGYIGNVVDYLITPTGWLLLIRTNSKELILSKFKAKKKKSKTIKRAIRKEDVSVLISESLRIMISIITRQINRNNKRLGAVVKGNFDRFSVESLDSLVKLIRKMKDSLIDLKSQRRKYNPFTNHWYKKMRIKINNSFFCSKNRRDNECKQLIFMTFEGFDEDVLRDYFVSYFKTRVTAVK